MRTHIYIATTQGPVAVQRLVQEDDDVSSLVCLNHGSKRLPMSQAYYDFVQKGSGIIAKDFDHSAWRMDVSAPISDGESWQLGVYLAHYFYRIGRLGDGNPAAGDRMILASGRVQTTRDVLPVTDMPVKFERAASLVNECAENSVECYVALPEACRHTLTDTWQTDAGWHQEVQLRLLSSVKSIEHYFEVDAACDKQEAQVVKGAADKGRFPLWVAVAGGVLALIVAFVLVGQRTDSAANPRGLELDDFGSRPVQDWEE